MVDMLDLEVRQKAMDALGDQFDLNGSTMDLRTDQCRLCAEQLINEYIAASQQP
jgi:hypothetical protein